MNQPLACLNGRWLPASEAAIGLTDAGFLQGVTVSEQLRTFGGRLFRLEDHLRRLAESLALVQVDPGFTLEELAQQASSLTKHNHALLEPGDDLGLSLFVTPGTYGTFAAAGSTGPVIGLHTYPLPFGQWADRYESGQRLAAVGVRQVPEASWPPRLKCRSRMHYYLADLEARRQHPQARALLLSARGTLNETATANVLLYRQEQGLLSPPLAEILPGISLETVRELSAELSLKFSFRDLDVRDLLAADEVLLSSTPNCLLPVTWWNDQPLGGGQPGPVFRQLIERWSARVGCDIVGQAARFARRG